ncbi:MAG: ABC transporter substrate-binding protein [Janthinobacterium lividum]
MKRTWFGVAIAALLTCGSVALPAQAADTIKIGVVTIDSGPMELVSKYVVDSAKLWVDTMNAQGGVNGRKFEIVSETNNGTPAGAISSVTRAVQQDGASFIIGSMTSSMSLALAPRMGSLNALLLDNMSGTAELVEKSCQPNYFRFAPTDSSTLQAYRRLLKQAGIKTWSVIASDYAAGHSYADQFTQVAKDTGGEVKLRLFEPLGTSDFGSYISQLRDNPSEGLFVYVIGSDAMAFAKQQDQYGQLKKYKMVVSTSWTNDTVLSIQGNAMLGFYATLPYYYTMPGARNAAFVKAFEERYHRKPSFIDADPYVTLEMLKAAIEKAKSTDVDKVRAALSGLKTDTVYGNIEMRAADHMLMHQMLMAQVVKGTDGKPTFSIIYSAPGNEIAPPPSPACKL